ncbi:TetR/AcrR family transcriptional regulator [Kineococcus rhizosphaerae]|uniref:TetR family transcriptional regulator n=1 Tax=Kineococcus rhizosphaerae TaxID=559628 RepID=A0A2T0R651_9ACTN|nr:TetR/AcrR family transcriptional regulator [Kineococcus rhizosphaerae]PRY16621.1 TetR family transcriptional regulator [Kineococcus rhizosphaerae]
MARWAPGAGDRLQAAALDLFTDQGYDQTTVSQIAERAGVTDRTFFRWFPDKREVLFAGSERLLALFTDAVAGSPATDPVEIAADALAASTAFFAEERRPWARRRAAVVYGHPALAEREQLKMLTLAAALAEALRGRGVPEPDATLLGHTTVTVFQVSFEAWIRPDETREMAQIQRETFAALRETLGRVSTPG